VAACQERTPKLMQSVVDAAPHARSYYSDSFNTYPELCWWGAHTVMYDKSQTWLCGLPPDKMLVGTFYEHNLTADIKAYYQIQVRSFAFCCLRGVNRPLRR
jgi:hypothetical protein